MTADRSDPPPTDWTAVDDAIDDTDAAGFVAVGGRFDPDLRYLSRVEGPDRGYAVVRTAGTSVVCVPENHLQRAERRFGGRVDREHLGDPLGVRAAAVLDDLGTGTGTLLVPATIPHDAAVYLERAGYDLRSTTAVADTRSVKSDAEVASIRAVQRAATAGVRQAERTLATADADADGTLTRDGRPLTPERLRRATNAELAGRGVTDASNTVVTAGAPDPGESSSQGAAPADAPIRATAPVAVGVAPRGPHGYHGSLARTFVVDSDGGWDRRAYVAAESALDAALAEVEAGAGAAAVGRELDAEITAFGFDPGATDGPPPRGYGVGLSRRERPFLDADADLAAGTVVVLQASVADRERGTVRLRDLVVVRPAGYERLGGGDRAFTPRE